jgi:hypothetical protein
VTQDVTKLGESSVLTVGTARHDAQRWRCHTQLRRLTIPNGFRRADLRDLQELEALTSRYGIQQVKDGDALRNIGELQAQILAGAGVEPELLEIEGNLLVYGGASCQWQTLIGNGTTTAGQALTYFNNAQAAIGVGDSTTAAAATQTNLVAATNKLRKAMDATYPQHTDATTSGAASIVFRSTFATSDANFAWQEWGIFNSTTDGTGRMLNRKVESLGTKTSASTWPLTLTQSLA